MDECSKNTLDCLVGSHGLTQVVGALSEIAANTSTVQMADGSRDSKREAKQWSKMSIRFIARVSWGYERTVRK
jgi:hypothetical protein